MLRLLYSLALTLAVPLILLRLLLRSLRAPAYRQRIGERFARFDLPDKFDPAAKTVWIHAVSVGETVAVAPLVDALLQHHPALQIVITTMTPTGSDRVRALFADRVVHVYAPYDLPGTVNRFIDRVNPALLVLMETELWPNMIHHCSRRGIAVMLANARLSERSARAYGRLGSLTRAMLEKLDAIAAQSEADARRLLELGAVAKRLTVTGSLKFNIAAGKADCSDDIVMQSVQESGRTVLIAASTRAGEEQKVLVAYAQLLQHTPELLLVLVPRHPERFSEVIKLCESQRLRVQRRSEKTAIDADTQVLVGDSMGEMPCYYQLADIAFVGGSLVDTGCQNVLEPAALGLPILAGPSQYNFAAICAQLQQAGALITVADPTALASRCQELIEKPELRQQMGAAGRVLVEANQQALPALLLMLDQLLAEG